MSTSAGAHPTHAHHTLRAEALQTPWRARRGFRLLATVLATAVVATTAALTPAMSASAALGSVGPISPDGAPDAGFPAWFTDKNGLALTMCLDGDPLCIAGGDFLDLHALGEESEAFYWAADAQVGVFEHHNALEATFMAEGPGMETVFMRTQVRAKDANLPVGAVYTVTDPYGTFNCTVDDEGEIPSNGCRIETTPVELEPERALKGRIGPFLTWDTFADPSLGEAPPEGYIGDNSTPHKVVGSPTGFNKVRIEGPGVNPNLDMSCSEDYEGLPEDCAETDLFIIQGKLHEGPSGLLSESFLDFGNIGEPATKSVTFSSTGTADINVESVVLDGSDDFSVVEDCTGTLAIGATCTVDVTYTPTGSGTDDATITIVDDTTASPREIYVTGSSTSGSSVGDAEYGILFGNQKVGTTSAPRVVTVTNTGVQPLEVTSATLPGGPGHFAIAANDCTEPVAAGGACEIQLTFAPTSTGFKSSALTIETDAGSHVVYLSGNGAQASVSVSTSTLAFGDVAGDSSKSMTVRLANNGSASVVVDGVAIAGPDSARFTIGNNTCAFGTNLAPGQQCVTQVVFTPGSAGTKSATLTISADDVPVDIALTGTGLSSTPDTEAPSAPTGVTSTPTSTTSIALSWTAATDDRAVVGYRIYRDGSDAALTSVTGTSFTDSGLEEGATHTYRIVAVDAAGNESEATEEITASTEAVDTEAPSAPTGVTVETTGTTSLRVTWHAASDDVGVTGYRVYRDGETTPVPISGTTWTHAGLAPGSTHSYEVSAVDARGNESERSQAVSGTTTTPDTTAPTVPGSLTATANGTSRIDLSWTASTDNVGVIGYRVYRDGEAAPLVTGTTYSHTGLAGSSTHTYEVSAVDAAGNESARTPIVSATTARPVTVPGYPIIHPPVRGDASVTLSWAAPLDNGGAEITGYEVTAYEGSTGTTPVRTETVGAVTSTVITGLVNGSPYTFRVAAINSAGTGMTSLRSQQVTPAAAATVPGAPIVGSVTPGNGSATVRWTAPASNGGSTITGYTVRAVNAAGAQVSTTNAAASATSVTVSGLTNGTSYSFEVRAVNAVGNGPWSQRSTAVTPVAPVTVPGAPTISGVAAGNASATVSWTAPVSTGGSAITGYSVRTYRGTTLVSTTQVAGGTSAVITGLTNRTSYRFSVAAVNSAGTGAYSAQSASVRPVAQATAPGAPTIGAPTAGNGSVTVRWTAPASTGGASITGYTVRTWSGSTLVRTTQVGSVTSTAVTGLANNTAYTFDVAARNPVGTGGWSARSAAVTPRGDTTAPTVSSRTPGVNATAVSTTGNVTVTFSEAVTGVSATTVTLRSAAGTAVPSTTVSYNATTRTVTLNPGGGSRTNLANDTRYTVALTSGIRDAAGNTLGATSWTFTTGPAPTVTGRTPGSNANNVSRGSNVTITFSEAVTGVSSSTVVVQPLSRNGSAGAAIAGTVTYNAGSRTATFNPYGTASTQLAGNTRFRVTVTNGIRDNAGNALSATNWVFTTRR